MKNIDGENLGLKIFKWAIDINIQKQTFEDVLEFVRKCNKQSKRTLQS